MLEPAIKFEVVQTVPFYNMAEHVELAEDLARFLVETTEPKELDWLLS